MFDSGQNTLFGKKTIKTISYNEQEIIRDILHLHCNDQPIECDPTYSIGNFYKHGLPKPKYRFDIEPQSEDVERASADKLPLENESVGVLMFDPPFICGIPADAPIGLMKDRFGYFKNVPELWGFYERAIVEFSRVIKKDGVLIFKCQDTVDSGKNCMSHHEIMTMAINNGFYPKDLFVLLAKMRILDVDPENQQHARKFHSYFWVFERKASRVCYRAKNINV